MMWKIEREREKWRKEYFYDDGKINHSIIDVMSSHQFWAFGFFIGTLFLMTKKILYKQIADIYVRPKKERAHFNYDAGRKTSGANLF